jgi:hypothetical protein
MIISMQGNWTVTVKSKNAAYQQRFVVQGATTGNGVHSGAPGTSVYVTGNQWSIAIQHNPGTGWQLSYTKLQFPHQSGGNYLFDILSDDSREDADFNDLILTCSTPVNINDFIVYGNVTLYSGRCIFNPCRQYPYYVIDTYPGLLAALKNDRIRALIEELYPERIPRHVDPNPPDPPLLFKPIVFDLGGEAIQPKTSLKYVRKQVVDSKRDLKSGKEANSRFAASDFELVSAAGANSAVQALAISQDKIKLVRDLGKLFMPCFTDPGSNLTLTFEEYDRTAAELAGGAYTGEGNRRLLGDTITDMNGNYIFRFSFDMTFPGLEDSSDITIGEDVNTVMYPDVIVKIVEYSPFQVRYESAPFYNIPNLKRINLCLPESSVHVSSACFNGNLIGSLGNVFIGGNQNTIGSTSAAATQRYGDSNYLESTGLVSVNSPLAGFNIECAAWYGTIDMKGCMYDAAKSAADNHIKWYTIRVRRSGTIGWHYVSQNYKHPKFSKRNLPNYIGDDVGPFYPNISAVLDGTVPTYTNIQREIFADGIDWEFSNLDRYMQLSTSLYDVVGGTRTPGKFYVRVDGYDTAGNHVPDATDLIALYIHNNGLNFQMTTPSFNDSAILNAGCGLFRLTDLQLKTPIVFSFEANDPYGFVDYYDLVMGRCPDTSLDLKTNIEVSPMNPDGNFSIAGTHAFPGGSNSSNVHTNNPICPGYKGTESDYSNPGLVSVQIEPRVVGDGWIKTGEYFTVYSFDLQARQRVTNGYNSGRSDLYHAWAQILMERLNP